MELYVAISGLFLCVTVLVAEEENNSDISTSLADFSLQLLRESTDANSSAILSPASVAITLAMAYAGAKGSTKEQIGQAIAKGASTDEALQYYSALMADLSGTTDGVTLNAANKLYVGNNIDLLPTYVDVIQTKFQGSLEKVDFTNAAAVVKEVNDWVAYQTNSKIKDLISEDDINALTRLILINAIYFKGNWQRQFDKSLTIKKPFFSGPGVQREVDMMRKTEKLPYTETDDLQVLGLPYNNSDVAMYIFLPKAKFGLDSLIQTITGQEIIALTQSLRSNREIEVELPRFMLEKSVELGDTLQELGIRDAFDARTADFSNMAEERLFISKAIHKAFIEVNEEGSEAAAATGLLIALTSAVLPPSPPVKFIADHPFMFAIMKRDVILFIGKLA